YFVIVNSNCDIWCNTNSKVTDRASQKKWTKVNNHHKSGYLTSSTRRLISGGCLGRWLINGIGLFWHYPLRLQPDTCTCVTLHQSTPCSVLYCWKKTLMTLHKAC